MDGVELRTTHAHGVELSLTAPQRAEVRKQFEASPIKIAGLGTTCEYHGADPAVVRKNVEETKQWVQLARDLGCPSVKVRPNGLRKDVPEDVTLRQIGTALMTNRSKIVALANAGGKLGDAERFRLLVDAVQDHAIYMADSGRFNIVGLSDDEIDRFTAAVVGILDA